MKKVISIFIFLAIVLSACNVSGNNSQPAAPTYDINNWDSVVEAANGQTVNWYIWGGSESINSFVDDFYGKALKEQYNITLYRIPVADTVDAVNQVLSEKQAGKETGTVDLIWINGENFATLKQADLLLEPWADKLPNSQFVNWENPAINRDFGTPVNFQESPWSSAQFQFIYDSARMGAEDLPRSYTELKDWVKINPGRFTYIAPGPGAFQGTRFIKGALYEISGKVEEWGTFNQALWDEYSPLLWDYLNEIEPYLWRQGETYPKDENELHSLFANKEIDFSITQAIVGAGALIEQGLVPDTAKAFVFDNYMIGDFNYVGIPVNAPNKAAALVLANLILDPELQAAQILPENGFGLGFGIDINRVTDPKLQENLRDASQKLGNAATDPADLAKSLVGDTAAEYQNLVEDGWREFVLQK
jgi:putative spermidine/putrescine transport system substrate-binding protein